MKRKNKFKTWYLNYFDWNKDGITNWWEYLIPFGFILLIEVIAEIIGILIFYYFYPMILINFLIGFPDVYTRVTYFMNWINQIRMLY